MAAIAIAGDVATTTSLALATSWPMSDRPGSDGHDRSDPVAVAGDGIRHDELILVEADRSGGSIAAWLDVPVAPSLSSVVAAARRSGAVDPLVRRTRDGLRYLPCPVSVREAERSVDEAESSVLPDLARRSTLLVDVGRVRHGAIPPVVQLASVVVLVHRQETASPRAAAVRLERFAEHVADLRTTHPVVVTAIVGDRPFGADEIARHCGSDGAGRHLTLADDPLAAAVLAGGTGASGRRLRRQPLLRDARRAAASLASLLATRAAVPTTGEGRPRPASPSDPAPTGSGARHSTGHPTGGGERR